MSIAASAYKLNYTWSRLITATTRQAQFASVDTNKARRRCRTRLFTTTLRSQVISDPSLNGDFEKTFVNALVQASSSKICRGQRITRATATPATKRRTWVQSAISYNRLPVLIREDVEKIGIAFLKKCLLGLVDYYNDYEDSQGSAKSASVDHDMVEKPPKLEMREEHSRPVLIKTLDDQNLQKLADICQAIDSVHYMIVPDQQQGARCRDMTIEIDRIFRLYHSLPAARFMYLSPRYRSMLLDLGIFVPKKTEMTTLRYLSLLNDMKQVNIRIPKSNYNHAIHLVGRTMTKVMDTAVESALRYWTSMELFSSGDVTTFNILLDVAVKGQQFGLAEMVIAEMDQRGLTPDRFTRTGLIYYHGVRGDGDSIRKTYRELVEKDVIIDTSVLNCVIASLLRAGEAEAAHHVYRRMKDFSAAQNEARLAECRSSKAITKTLRNLVQCLGPEDIELLRLLQPEQDISPDEKTFSIFVSHHVSETGDIDAITGWLDDMQRSGISPYGRIFFDLFRGFSFHGGVRFTLWNRATLEKVWRAFQELANEESSDRVFWDTWVVIWILRAYIRCYGHEAAMEKWSTIKADWNKASEHERFILSVIDENEKKKRQHRRSRNQSAFHEVWDSKTS